MGGSCVAAKKHIHEILLAFPGHFRCFVDAGVSVAVVDDGFLDLEQPQLHGLLSGHVVVVALPLDKES